jgi:energy-coupling factor transporter transmembrane protein EcfT
VVDTEFSNPRIKKGKVDPHFYSELYEILDSNGGVVKFVKWQDPGYKDRWIRLKWNKQFRITYRIVNALVLNINSWYLYSILLCLIVFAVTKNGNLIFYPAMIPSCTFLFLILTIGVFRQILPFHHPHIGIATLDTETGVIEIDYRDNETFISPSSLYRYQLTIETDRTVRIVDLSNKNPKKAPIQGAQVILDTIAMSRVFN